MNRNKPSYVSMLVDGGWTERRTPLSFWPIYERRNRKGLERIVMVENRWVYFQGNLPQFAGDLQECLSEAG